MTAGRRAAAAPKRRRGKQPGARPRPPSPDGVIGELEARLAAVEARLGQVQRAQERQFVQLMKFAVLRHISALSLIIEQSAAPPPIAAHIRRIGGETARKIAEAKGLDEVRELDMALQREVRHVLAAFKLV